MLKENTIKNFGFGVNMYSLNPDKVGQQTWLVSSTMEKYQLQRHAEQINKDSMFSYQNYFLRLSKGIVVFC